MEIRVRPQDRLVWSVATRNRSGELESGDRHIVECFDEGGRIVVLDALGHGPHAARTAAVASRLLAGQALASPASLIRSCHRQMRGTRGITVCLAAFQWSTQCLNWLGIGSGLGVLVRSKLPGRHAITPLLVRAGVVGDRLPDLTAITYPFECGDTLILTTDGIQVSFTDALPSRDHPEVLARRILEGYGKDSDDALVLVARREKSGSETREVA